MRFRYSTTDPAQTEYDSLPRVTLILTNGSNSVEVLGLVDSGATVSVLPYGIGLRLGMRWDERKAVIPLSGSLGNIPAAPAFALATIGDLPVVRLAFAWAREEKVPLILGQSNFFMEFDVHFYRSRLEFEVTPRS